MENSEPVQTVESQRPGLRYWAQPFGNSVSLGNTVLKDRGKEDYQQKSDSTRAASLASNT